MAQKTPYDLCSICFSLGCLPLLFLPTLPSQLVWGGIFGVLLLVIIAHCYFKKRIARFIGFILIGLLWSTQSASESLSSIEHYIEQNLTIRVEVSSLNVGQNSLSTNDRYHYIQFKIQQINQQTLSAPLTISLNWQAKILPFAGEIWDMRIKTKVVHSYLNEGSFDSQRFAIANRHLLSATVSEAKLYQANINLRQQIVNTALPYIKLFNYQDMILALAFGERSLLTSQHKTIMQQTGIAHLLAISGMHIVLVAYLANRLARGIQYFLPIKLICYWHPLIIGWGCAVFYAWLSGLNPPAIRAILALSLWMIFRYQNRPLSSWQMINRIIAILLFIDPLMILSESFWLSCYAVICLVFMSQWLPSTRKSYILQLLRLQLLLTVLLFPIQLFIFNGSSGSSVIANLVAIPLISFITFPAILFMLVMSLLNCFYLAIWFGYVAEQSLSWLFKLLEPITFYWLDIPHCYYLLSGIGWLTIIVWRTMVWRRYFMSIIIMLLIMFTPIYKQQPENWRIDMLDVGHGLAIVIRQGQSAILYDTGAAWQDSSAAQRIILPFLIWHNLTLEGIIISHEHNDHIGGLALIQQHYPTAWLMSSSKSLNNDYNCVSDSKFNWQQLQLSILWPNQLSDLALNAQSCVVQISDGRYTLLLTGDLEKAQEESLVLKYGQSLFATILQIPHHGSNTSSFYPFLSHVNPAISLGSVARYNPWRLPSNKALQRYQDLHISYYLTRSSGQISLFIYHDNMVLKTMRKAIKPKWYHDWFGALPNYG